MLSPGNYHLEVPHDPVENLIYRAHILKAAAKSPALQRGLIAACRRDIFFYIDCFAIQYNPLHRGEEYGPFVTWDFQREAIRDILMCVEEGGTYVMEKSREMGGTYICLLVADWLCRFHRGKKVLMISRNAEAVDKKGESDSIFWKIDTIHSHLPAWFGAVTRRSMRIIYENTGSRITGTASTDAAGVGGRASLIFVDEFSRIGPDKEVREFTANTSDSRIFNGTHLGLSTELYKLCTSPEVKKIQMHWTQHPEKVPGLYQYDSKRPGIPIILDQSYKFPLDYKFVLDGTPTGGPRPGVRSPWYDKKCREIGGGRAVSMDLDINPSGSVAQFFDASLIRELYLNSRDPLWRGNLEYDRDSGEPRMLVQHADGPIKLWTNPNHLGRPASARYVAGMDVSGGTGATPSCLSIMATQTGMKVAEYANNRIDPERFAVFVVAMARLFADANLMGATLVWEKAGSVGTTFGQKVVDLGYRRLYYHTDKSSLGNKVSDRPGWFPSAEAMGTLLRDYHIGLANRGCVNYSASALEECLQFEYGSRNEPVHNSERNKKREPGETGANHGDMVVADALAWMLCLQVGKPTVSKEVVDEVPYGSILWRRRERTMAAMDAEPGEGW